ncbi:MAG: type II secretion system minor pseudopilin GspI [Aquabacterium sp.]
MNRQTARRLRAGFTLVEVLVALAIVALALGTGIKAAGALTDNAQRLADVTAAQWCADNALTNLRLQRTLPGIGESSFDCPQLGVSYRGKMVAQRTPNINFNRVEAQVADADGRPLVTLATVMGRY